MDGMRNDTAAQGGVRSQLQPKECFETSQTSRSDCQSTQHRAAQLVAQQGSRQGPSWPTKLAAALPEHSSCPRGITTKSKARGAFSRQ